MNLRPPQNWRKGLTKAMSELLNLEERLQEIKDVIQGMDKRWDHGFFANEEEYIRKRIELQMELEQLTPTSPQKLLQNQC